MVFAKTPIVILLVVLGCQPLDAERGKNNRAAARGSSAAWRELPHMRIEPHGRTVGALRFSADSQLLATGSYDQTAWIMGIPQNDPLERGQIDFLCRLQGHRGPITFVGFTPQNEIVTSAQDETVRRWQVQVGRELQLIMDHGAATVALSPDGETVAVGTATDPQAQQKEVRLLRTSDGSVLRKFQGESPFRSVAFSPDGKLLATGQANGIVQLWNLDDGERLQTSKQHEHAISHLVFSLDGRLLLGADQEGGAIFIWSLPKLELNQQVWYGQSLLGLAISPDSTLFATAGISDEVPSPSLHLWRLIDGQRLQVLVDGVPEATSVAFSPDGRFLAAGMNDGTLRLFVP